MTAKFSKKDIGKNELKNTNARISNKKNDKSVGFCHSGNSLGKEFHKNDYRRKEGECKFSF